MEVFLEQILNGLVYGVLLFLTAAGLSLIFGLMNVVSLAHGSFFMLGGYVAFTIYRLTGSFWLALVLAPVPIALAGIAMEMAFLRPLYRRGHLDQVLLTFGFTFIIFDLVQTLWGRDVLALPQPAALDGVVRAGHRRVLDLPALSDRARCRHRGGVVAVPRALAPRRAWCAPASTTRRWRPDSAATSRPCSPRSSARGVGPGGAGRRRGGPDLRHVSGRGRRDPDSRRSSSSWSAAWAACAARLSAAC